MSEADRYFIKKGFSKVIKQGIEEFTDDDGNYIHFDLVIERFTCNCYLSAKELQAINKKVEELRMDMNNKASDKNFANIEDDVKIVKEFIDYAQGVIDDMEYERPVDVTVYQKDLTSMKHILAELEQKDKRIQELEEQVKMLDEAYTGTIKESKKWFDIAHNSIPTQVVIDKMEELNKEIKSCDEIDAIFKIKQQQILQELLEGERK